MAGRGDVAPSGFGERLKAIREEKGLTQKQLGEKAEVHANTLAKLERNEQEPNWPLVLKLANALGVDCTAFSAEATPPAGEPEPKPKKPTPKGKPKK
ncbi:MAG: hypothetical protein C0467_33105 [Planctomycetaceae bacterium]|nr:hypothetical protein [Planctomycetaceae bacterium]